MTIHKAIQELFASRGFTTGVRNGRRVGFFHGTGHGSVWKSTNIRACKKLS
jgi:hypothetical protein